MSPDPSPQNAERGFPADRVKAFTDGVLAIILTILVLEIEAPELDDSPPNLMEFASHLFRQLHPYIASFVAVAVFWTQHVMVLKYVERIDRTFLWLNIVYLLPLSLLPFFTGLRVDHPSWIITESLFGLSFITSSLLTLWMWRYACHQRRLVSPDIDPRFVYTMSRRVLTVTVISLVGILVSLASPHLGSAVFVSIPVLLIIFGDPE